jgi:hypothetical protein
METHADGHPQQIREPENFADDHPRLFFFSRLADFYALQPFVSNHTAKSRPPALLFNKSLVVLKNQIKTSICEYALGNYASER